MLRRMLVLVGSLLLGAAAAAQVRPGLPAPPLAVDWGQVPELALAGDAAPPCTVLLFHKSLAVAAIDASVLRQLRPGPGLRGPQAVLIVPAAEEPVPPALAGCTIVRDRGARALWLGEQLDFYVVVVAAGQVAWIGRPEEGLLAAVAALAAGQSDAARSFETWRRRQELLAGFVETPGETSLRLARRLVADCPTDGPSRALCYLLESELGDAAAAGRTLDAALTALPAEPRALASFADLALRGDAQNKELARRLEPPLAAAAADYRDDLRVQLTWLRALVRTGQGREVGRQAHRLARSVERVASAALEFAEILAHDEPAAVHKELVARALGAAESLHADARLLAAVRYALHRRCEGDAAAARQIARDYMLAAQGRVVLNNDAWAFMTDLPTRGRCDEFALALVERMLEQKDAMDYFEFDTAALAMYLNGRVAEAIELQQTAIEKGGEDPGYGERLRRYRSALPAPR